MLLSTIPPAHLLLLLSALPLVLGRGTRDSLEKRTQNRTGSDQKKGKIFSLFR